MPPMALAQSKLPPADGPLINYCFLQYAFKIFLHIRTIKKLPKNAAGEPILYGVP